MRTTHESRPGARQHAAIRRRRSASVVEATSMPHTRNTYRRGVLRIDDRGRMPRYRFCQINDLIARESGISAAFAAGVFDHAAQSAMAPVRLRLDQIQSGLRLQRTAGGSSLQQNICAPQSGARCHSSAVSWAGAINHIIGAGPSRPPAHGACTAPAALLKSKKRLERLCSPKRLLRLAPMQHPIRAARQAAGQSRTNRESGGKRHVVSTYPHSAGSGGNTRLSS